MDKLLYIGKSNKKFTYNHIYKYFGYHKYKLNWKDDIEFSITIYDNHNILNFLTKLSYFEKNFKFITEIEYNKLIRKLKIEKINESKF